MPLKQPFRTRRHLSFRPRPWLERLEDRTLLSNSGQLYANPLEIIPPQENTLPSQSVAGDFTNNGKLDFVVATSEDTIDVYLGNGDGTFQAPVVCSTGSTTLVAQAITAGNFTSDGNLDLAFAAPGAITILLGNGNGTFQAPVTYSAPVSGTSIAVGDFNGDGNLDLVATDEQSGTVAVLLGNGNGTFQPAITSRATPSPTELTVGDFTGDGELDVAVCGGESQQIAVLPGNGNGTFQAPVLVSSSYNANAIASADLNGDGKLDLITADGHASGDIQVWLGEGGDKFQPPVTYAVGSDPVSIAVADLNGDSKPDIITGDAIAGGVSVLLNQGDGTFGAAATYNVAAAPNSILAADFNGDGAPDILTTGDQLALLTNNGNGTFQDCTQTLTDPDAPPDRIVAGDLNDDGFPDIVTSQTTDDTISVLLNDGHGGFDPPVSYSTGPGSDPQGLALADLAGNGILDIIVADSGTNAISVFIGNGDGTFRAPVTYATAGLFPCALAVGDLRGDGKMDVVTLDVQSGDISVFLGNGDGTFGTATPFSDGLGVPLGPGTTCDIALANFDGGTTLDAVVSNPFLSSDGLTLVPGNGNGTFGLPQAIPLPIPIQSYSVFGFAAGDLTGNGETDLVVTDYFTAPNSLYILLNNGNGTFRTSILALPTYDDAYFYTAEVVIGDFTGDGNMDVVVGGLNSQIALFPGNGDGTFQAPILIDAGPDADYMAAADFNGDGKLDIAAADNSADSNDITVLEPAKAATDTQAADATVTFSAAAQSVTLSAAVTSGGAGVSEGTVTFTVLAANNVQVGLPVTSGTVSGGNATATFALPAGEPAGTYTIQAIYDPGPDYQASSDSTHTLTVTPSTTSTVALDINASFSAFSQSVTLSAAVTSEGAGIDEGTVTFTVFAAGNVQVGLPVTSGTVSSGSATADFTVPAGQSSGAYLIQAVYNEGADYQGSSDSTHTLSVAKATSSTAASSVNATFSPSSQSLTLSAAVTSGGSGIDEGTVTFTVFAAGNVQVGLPVTSGIVSAGSAIASFILPASEAAGTYTIQAVYNPGTDYQGSSDSTHTLSVTRATTSTVAFNTSTTFSAVNQSVTLSAMVTSGGAGINEGSVTFTLYSAGNEEEGVPTISGTMSGGNASVSYGLPVGLSPGTYTIQAIYNPGSDYLGSSDSAHTLVVGQAATTTTAADATATYSTNVQSVTLSAMVTSGVLGVGEGTITFTLLAAGNAQLGMPVISGTVSGGAASVSYSLPAGAAPGIYTIESQYSDASSGDYQSSSDATHTLFIGSTTSIAAVSASTPFSTAAQNITLQANLTSASGTINEGTVTFTLLGSHNNQVGSAVTSDTVTGGSASVTFALPAGTPAGTYVIQAQYVDASPGLFLPSLDSSHTLTIQQAPTTTTVANATTTFSSSGVEVPLSASLSSTGGTVNEGTVTFTVLNGSTEVGLPVTTSTVSGGAASANFNLPAGTLPGTYTLRVQFNDIGGSFIASNNSANPATLTITPATTTTAVSSALVAASAAAESVILQATIASASAMVSSGTVTFTVLQALTPLGSPVTSATITDGIAKATYTLPAGTPAGSYTVQAAYSGGGGFLASPPATNAFIVDAGPSLAPINGTNMITLSRGRLTDSVPLDVMSSSSLPLTYTTSKVGDNPIFDLQQKYQFQAIGYLTYGATAYVLHSNQAGPGIGGYYLIRPSDGALFAYDGSGSYAHTFANDTPLATLGANVYTDPTLLLNAQPPVDYTTLYNLQQQYQFNGLGYFTYGAAAYVLQSTTGNNSDGNPYYLLSSTGALYAYDGSGSYAHSISNGTALANLGANLYSYPAEFTNAEAPSAIYATLYPIQQQYDLQELNGSFYFNTYGNQAEWFYSPILNQFGQHWYTLTLQTVSDAQQAVLTAWEGYQDSEIGTVVATLDPSVYSHPTWLTDATALPDPAVTTSVDSSDSLSITLPNASYIGSFKVTVSVSDGLLSATQTVLVTSTDTTPVITVAQGNTAIPQGGSQTFTAGSFPQTDTVTTSNVDGGTLTASASVSSYDLPFTLEQQYQFKGLSYYSVGAAAYVLTADADNSYGNPYYLLSSSGALYPYDGSGSYAHTFANVTPLATLGANYYADPTLLLNAQPAVDYTALYNLMQQYQFTGLGTYTFGATAYVLHSNQAGPGFEGYYLLEPDGDLYAYDGSGSYAHTIANSANLVTTLDPSIYAEPSLLLNAQAAPGLYPQLYQIETQYDFKDVGYYIYGAPAYVLSAASNNANGNPYYLLNSNGDLYAYDGSGSYAHTFANSANLVATLDPSVYSNPSLLTNATAPVAATGVTATLTNGSLTLNAPASFVGTFQVTVTATDGIQTSTQTFQVTSTDSAPDLSPIAAQTASQSSSPLQLTLSATPANNGPVTYTATVAGYSAEYSLQQQYQFQGLGYVTAGATAYVLTINGLNANGNPYYLLSSTGGLYAYDGSGSYAHTFANSANLIAQLSPNDYTTPTLLTNAKAPTAPAAEVNVAGDQLTVNVTGLAEGTIFEVFVTASDGAETSRTGFLVTVTA
jgi:hypothetical protein